MRERGWAVDCRVSAMGLSKMLQEHITAAFVQAADGKFACRVCGTSLAWHVGRMGKHLAVQCEQFRLQSPAVAAHIYHSLPTSIPLSKADRKLGVDSPLIRAVHAVESTQSYTQLLTY